jgi:hypothetical protein
VCEAHWPFFDAVLLNKYMTTTAETMVLALEEFLSSNVGVDSVTVDGQSVKYNRSQAMTELKYWRSVVAKEGGKKKIVQQLNLGNVW